MAFEVKDYHMQYSKKGDPVSVFNIAREDPTDGDTYYGYMNDEGSYIIQQVTTSGTLKIYKYYARVHKAQFDTDWTDRASLSYLEYHELFKTESW